MYGLIDCNNFYASCERLFQPKLQHRPIVVLSNNDGCIVARSDEAKKLGIAMGTPYFQAKDLIRHHNVAVFSSNYALYGDISARVMTTLASFSPDIEIYSIDEAFLDFSALKNIDYENMASQIRKTVLQHVGIPVSAGIARTRTLAKLANKISKTSKNGYCVIASDQEINETLKKSDISDIWGIGKRSEIRLRRHGIHTLTKLCETRDSAIRKILGVTGLRTVYELRGISAVPEEEICSSSRKSICCSRSFRNNIFILNDLKEAISHYTCNALEKMRTEARTAGTITVFLNFRNEENPVRGLFNSITANLPVPSNANPDFLHLATAAVEKLYRRGYAYKSAGILLSNLGTNTSYQADFFQEETPYKTQHLLQTLDKLNSKYGRGTVHYAAEGTAKPWTMKQTRRSPRYTTCWEELLNMDTWDGKNEINYHGKSFANRVCSD